MESIALLLMFSFETKFFTIFQIFLLFKVFNIDIK